MATFTPRELELLTIAFQCLKEKPNIDYDLMATKAGLKGVKSARDSFGPLYNKIVSGQKISAAANGEGGEQIGGLSPKEKKKATPSKRKAADGDDDDDSSPSKKKKATPGKAKGKKKPVAEDEGEDGTVDVKSEVVDEAGVGE